MIQDELKEADQMYSVVRGDTRRHKGLPFYTQKVVNI